MWNFPEAVIETAVFVVGTGAEYDVFNYFFTLVCIFGMMGWGFGLLCSIIRDS